MNSVTKEINDLHKYLNPPEISDSHREVLQSGEQVRSLKEDVLMFRDKYEES